MRADIIRKIRALLAKRIERGCRHGEELAARDKAFELMKAHNISPAEIGPEAEPMSLFDYTVFSEEVAAELRAAASKIRHRSQESMIEIGRSLLQVKKILKHGQFLTQFRSFLEIECGLTLRSAENAMSAARLMADPKNEMFSNLPITGLYALARKSTPEAVREQVRRLLSQGERPSVGRIKQVVSEEIGATKGSPSGQQPPSATGPRAVWEARARHLIELLVTAAKDLPEVQNGPEIRRLLALCGLQHLEELLVTGSRRHVDRDQREAA